MVPFQLELEGVDAGGCSAVGIANNALSAAFTECDGTFFHEKYGLSVEQTGGALTIYNRSDKTRIVNRFSAYAALDLKGADCAEIIVHWFDCSWEQEFQYRSASLRELGVYPVAVHPVVKSFSLLSYGSWTTCRHVPFVVVENKKSGESLWCAGAFAAGWRLETGLRGDSVYLDAAEVDLRSLGVRLPLGAGESFTASPVFFGTVKGGFEAAVAAHYHKFRSYAEGKSSPVVVNDYMNCLWARPSSEKLVPLIEAAAEAGAEVFCIDDGWFCESNADRGGILGDWQYSDEPFGSIGFKGIIDLIRSKGMRAGIWFEFESCGEKSALYRKPDSWFVCRDKIRIGGADRHFLNFENEEVCAYIAGVVKKYYDLGIRYLKNDYNACMDGGREVLAHARAVRAFFKRLKAQFPDLIFENCGSGAMRCDDGMLQFSDMQSTSDQEITANYASIALGALAVMPPEVAGIWAYPYRHDFVGYFTGKPFRKEQTSHNEVIFSLVTGLAGTPYFSGRIDCMESEDKELLRQAVQIHKQTRAFKARAVARFPLGLPRIHEEQRPLALLLQDGKEGLLYIWRREGGEEVDLPVRIRSAEQIFPPRKQPVSLLPDGVRVVLQEKNTAAIYRVVTEETNG